FDEANIDVLSLKTGERKTIQRGGYFGRYLTTGHLVYLRGNTLFAAPFDVAHLETRGTPVPLLEGVRASVGFGGGQFDVSRNGRMVYLPGSVSNEVQPIVWLDAAGKTTPLIPPGYAVGPRISPDGKQLAAMIRFPTWDLKVYDLQRGNSTQLT